VTNPPTSRRSPRPGLAILRAQLHDLLNHWRHASRGARLRIAAGLGLALLTFVAFHQATFASLELAAEKSPLAEAMADRLVEAVLLLQVLVVGLSALLMAFAQLFSSRDTPYLAVLPLPERSIYGAKVLAVAAGAGWMPTLVAAAVISASGRFLDVGPGFYPLALLPLLACLAVPALLSVGLASTAARWLPLNHPRSMSLLLSAVAGATLLAVLWRLEPQRFLDIDSVDDVASAVSHLRFDSARYLPVGDAAEILRALSGRVSLAAAPLLRLVGWVLAAASIGVVAFRYSFRRALSTSLEARQPAATRARATAFEPGPALVRWLGRERAAIVTKDLRIFLRDPSQWTQGLFIVALVGIYLTTAANAPMDDVEALGLSADVFASVLAYTSFTLSGLLLSAVALRFLFTSVSLEGRAAWLVLSAPIDTRQVLRAKIAAGYPALAGLGLILVTGSGLLLDAAPAILLWTSGGILLVTRGLAGLAVGLGGAMPNFDASHPMKVSSGLGGLTFSATAIAYVFAMATLLLFPSAWFSSSRATGSEVSLAGGLIGAGFVVAALALTALVSLLPVRLAARRLRRGGG